VIIIFGWMTMMKKYSVFFKVSLFFTLLVSFTLAVVLAKHYYYSGKSLIRSLPYSSKFPPFDFVPDIPEKLFDCNRLFGSDTKAVNFSLSSMFQNHYSTFAAAAIKSQAGEAVEGYSFPRFAQYKAIHYLASQPNVRNICETGFNLGHSSFNYLTVNNRTVVHSFDLGKHRYAHKMAAFLMHKFSGRLFVHFGDSTHTVPEFVIAHPSHRCDFIFVDGGHLYAVAMSDLLNLSAIANTDTGNVIMFDNYPDPNPHSVMRVIAPAWEKMLQLGYVRELFRCTYTPNVSGGFVVGTVVRRPLI